MARLPQSRKLLVEDFPNQPWIAPLLSAVNQFMDDVRSTLNQGLTVDDNMLGKMITVELDGQFPKRITWPFVKKPKSVLVGDWYRKDQSTKELVLSAIGNTNTNKTVDSLDSVVGLRAGLLVSGAGVPNDTHIISVDSSFAITISRPATATATDIALTFEYDQAIQVRWSFNQSNELVIEDVLGIEPNSTNKFVIILECKAI